MTTPPASEPLGPTPGQTVGPFFGHALPFAADNEIVPPSAPDAVRLTGRVLDGAGTAVPDALVEIWQPDEQGRVSDLAGSLTRDGWTFTGWGRCATGPDGRFSFTTVRPGPGPGGGLPFFAVAVVARGLLDRLFSRCYLPATTAGVESDPFLATLPPERRSTLVARERGRDLVFDIVLQGARETVFLRHDRGRP